MSGRADYHLHNNGVRRVDVIDRRSRRGQRIPDVFDEIQEVRKGGKTKIKGELALAINLTSVTNFNDKDNQFTPINAQDCTVFSYP